MDSIRDNSQYFKSLAKKHINNKGYKEIINFNDIYNMIA